MAALKPGRGPGRPEPKKIIDQQVGHWWQCHWSDGTEQWSVYNLESRAVLYIERVVRAKSRRKNWCIVTRKAAKRGSFANIQAFNTGMYPPKVAGPFEDLEGAKAALLVLLSTGDYT